MHCYVNTNYIIICVFIFPDIDKIVLFIKKYPVKRLHKIVPLLKYIAYYEL